MRRIATVLVALSACGLAGADEYFVPMVGQKQGQDGAWWNTEVWISNTGTITGGYAAVFLPAGQPNLEGLRSDPVLSDLAPGETIYRNDLVPEGGVGVLRFVTTQGVVVFTRVFNAAGKGSFGQGMPALPRSAAARPGETVQLLGLRRTPQFRTNISLFNPSTENGVIHVRIYSQRGDVAGEESYRLAPGGYLQLDDALHSFGVPRGEHLRAEITGTVAFFAFASVIDTRSGAPTLVPAVH
ncbi:MAG TPA: hypothetical protein VMT19_03535 [Thermoanaerobaculaceae bacterium]|nr:hypothetical protein [Thermoanaerobaculaceae bacterium]